jgi:cytochrome c
MGVVARQAGLTRPPPVLPGECNENRDCGTRLGQEAELLRFTIVFATLMAASNALAADAGNGKRLAESHCAACHKIAAGQRDEVADSPPFDVIGRKYGFAADVLTHAIIGPYPKMNFSPQPDEAADIAAYIATLAK